MLLFFCLFQLNCFYYLKNVFPTRLLEGSIHIFHFYFIEYSTNILITILIGAAHIVQMTLDSERFADYKGERTISEFRTNKVQKNGAIWLWMKQVIYLS